MRKAFIAILAAILLAMASFAQASPDMTIVPCDNRWVAIEENKRYAVEVRETSLVVVDIFVTNSCIASMLSQDGKTVAHSFQIYPGTSANPGTAALKAYVEPGTYEITIREDYGGADADWRPARLRARSRAIPAVDTGENGELTGAYPVDAGRRYLILRKTGRSGDYYALPRDSFGPRWYIVDVEASFTSIQFEALNDKGDVLHRTDVSLNDLSGDRDVLVSRRVPMYFPSGTSILRVSSYISDYSGVYSFLLERPPVPRKLKLQKALRLAPGFGTQLTPISTPVTGVLSNLKWKSSKPSVVAVDENGIVSALSKGIANITVQSGAAKASCRVTVGDNEYLKTRPGKLGKGKYIYAFTRRIAYQQDRLAAEVFLVNRSGKTLSGSQYVFLEIRDRDNRIYAAAEITNYTFAKPLKNGSTQVLKALFPKNDKDTLFLPSGDYRVNVTVADAPIQNESNW